MRAPLPRHPHRPARGFTLAPPVPGEKTPIEAVLPPEGEPSREEPLPPERETPAASEIQDEQEATLGSEGTERASEQCRLQVVEQDRGRADAVDPHPRERPGLEGRAVAHREDALLAERSELGVDPDRTGPVGAQAEVGRHPGRYQTRRQEREIGGEAATVDDLDVLRLDPDDRGRETHLDTAPFEQPLGPVPGPFGMRLEEAGAAVHEHDLDGRTDPSRPLGQVGRDLAAGRASPDHEQPAGPGAARPSLRELAAERAEPSDGLHATRVPGALDRAQIDFGPEIEREGVEGERIALGDLEASRVVVDAGGAGPNQAAPELGDERLGIDPIGLGRVSPTEHARRQTRVPECVGLDEHAVDAAGLEPAGRTHHVQVGVSRPDQDQTGPRSHACRSTPPWAGASRPRPWARGDGLHRRLAAACVSAHRSAGPTPRTERPAPSLTPSRGGSPRYSISVSDAPPTDNARRVLEARYLLRDAQGALAEDWEGLCRRVARAVAEVERDFGEDWLASEAAFADLMLSRTFLPNSPTLMNAGTELGQLAACFVLPVEDSLESIFDTVKRMALIHQSGGGTGFSFSRLRPEGDLVRRTHGVASGPVSFMRVFDAVTSVIKQGGRRRGANMGVLRFDHPDVRAFVAAKADAESLSNFNLSLTTPARFWRAVERGDALEAVKARDGRVTETLDARALLAEIAEHAWATGDPGIVFHDAIDRENPTPTQGPLEATNPCGELPLLANEACNLGSLRVDRFVREGRIDWERLEQSVARAVRFLDDVIEASHYPDAAITETVRGNRKIGLGVMGFADLLVDLGIAYDAPEAARVATELAERMRVAAERASALLAEKRGVFPRHAGSRAEARGLRLRNATVLSMAPTGTISILAGCSGGIEPYFALAFLRHVLDGARLPETVERFEQALRREGAWSQDLLDEVRARGSARGVRGVPEAVRRLFPIAADIAPAAHLAIQQAFQRHTDNAVSKTINLPHSATPADVAAIYRSAWERGLKGITVFRERSKGSAVLVRGSGQADEPIEAPAHFAGGCPTQRCP